jgi:hypothetical protein
MQLSGLKGLLLGFSLGLPEFQSILYQPKPLPARSIREPVDRIADHRERLADTAKTVQVVYGNLHHCYNGIYLLTHRPKMEQLVLGYRRRDFFRSFDVCQIATVWPNSMAGNDASAPFLH